MISLSDAGNQENYPEEAAVDIEDDFDVVEKS